MVACHAALVGELQKQYRAWVAFGVLRVAKAWHLLLFRNKALQALLGGVLE